MIRNWKSSTIYTSKMDEDKLEYYQNGDVINMILNKYPDFEMAYIPENYEVAFILLEENLGDSFQDSWKIIFFKKTLDVLDGGTITLDNISAMDTTKEKYEIYKTLDGSFENVINISCDLIAKHKALIKEKELISP